MKIGTTLVFCTLIGLASASAWSRFSDDAQNYWQCSAHDENDKTWVIQSAYERMAINKALAACKQESQAPLSCTVAKEYCAAFVHGQSTQPLWKCTALDDKAKAWVSNVYSQQDDAAIAALAYCKEQSAAPTSCYINVVTCRNMNKNHQE
jgi:hypothetical protein